jgi:protein-S-isoprenylcysteine O-methyltransferase Ste14
MHAQPSIANESPSFAAARGVGDAVLRGGRLVGDALKLGGVIVTAVVSRWPVRPLAGEAGRALPGDEVVSGPKVRWTHGVTIRSQPAEIWPWLIQMGCGRAGWYSYDGLDNGGAPSAERIHPELQHLEVGDVIPMRPGADDRFVIRAVEPGHALVLGDAAGSATWAFMLEPVDATRTRVVARSTGSYHRIIVGLLLKLLLRPIHYGMQRRQLLNVKRRVEHPATMGHGRSAAATLKLLVGSGDKIGLFTLPFLLIGVGLNVAYPSAFQVGGPPRGLWVVSVVALMAGVTIWIWSVLLILRNVPRGELITTGPYRLVKHPLYAGVALLVLPWLGFLVNSWLGAVIGTVLYLANRRFAPEEEAELSETFGCAWDDYRNIVKIRWL